jgi:hypothetical protein
VQGNQVVGDGRKEWVDVDNSFISLTSMSCRVFLDLGEVEVSG